jgi:hypothetical protein
MIVYDTSFNSNEWFTLTLIFSLFFIIFKLPKRFPITSSLTFYMFGMFIGTVADHTISIESFDFYDVNDTSKFSFTDFMTYVMYGPFAYLFCYIYDKYSTLQHHTILYILIWSLVAVAFEFIGTELGVYHYKNGYQLFFSFPIYLVVQTLNIFIYNIVKREAKKLSL